MRRLVMTSWLDRSLLALLIASAATQGSTRPVELLSTTVKAPEVPTLMFPEGHPPRLSLPTCLPMYSGGMHT